ncbi:3310_t:CDS:1, partial [Racocetra persica]
AEPADLNRAIQEIRKWETGRVMISENNTNGNENDQAIARLTEQIAKLNINLAKKQPATP